MFDSPADSTGIETDSITAITASIGLCSLRELLEAGAANPLRIDYSPVQPGDVCLGQVSDQAIGMAAQVLELLKQQSELETRLSLTVDPAERDLLLSDAYRLKEQSNLSRLMFNMMVVTETDCTWFNSGDIVLREGNVAVLNAETAYKNSVAKGLMYRAIDAHIEDAAGGRHVPKDSGSRHEDDMPEGIKGVLSALRSMMHRD